MKSSEYRITIGWLYPDLMSTYGDRGNILCLIKRCRWRSINVEIQKIDHKTTNKELSVCDVILGGGAQDRQQELAAADLRKKGKSLISLFHAGTPGLFVCGSPQLLGHYYMTGDGKKLEGLGFFDYVTKHFGHDKPRCIGNTAGIITGITVGVQNFEPLPNTIVGFENHGGRTYLGTETKPFAKVLHGFGNNGEDGTEGAVKENVIACYYHGPLLAKNPHIADWLIRKALAQKYGKEVHLPPLDDSLEWQAHRVMLQRLGITPPAPTTYYAKSSNSE